MFIVIHIDNNSHFVDIDDYKTQEEAQKEFDRICIQHEDEGAASGSVHLHEVLPEAYQFKIDESTSRLRELEAKSWDFGESYDEDDQNWDENGESEDDEDDEEFNEKFKRQGGLETAITRHVSIHYDREIELIRWNNNR